MIMNVEMERPALVENVSIHVLFKILVEDLLNAIQLDTKPIVSASQAMKVIHLYLVKL